MNKLIGRIADVTSEPPPAKRECADAVSGGQGRFVAAVLAGFSFLVVLMGLVVAVGVMHLGSLRTELETVVNSQLRRISQAHDLRMLIRERILALEAVFLRDDPFERDAAYLRFLELGNRFIAIRRALESGANDEEEEHQVLAAFRRETIAATPPVEAVVELYLQGQLEAGRRHLLDVAIPAQARVIATSDAVHAMYRERGEAAVAHARAVYDRAFRTLVGLGTVALALTLLTGALVGRRIVRDRAALLAEIGARRAAEASLRALQADLEAQVASRTARLQETTERLEEAQRVGQIGHWEWDIATGGLSWSAQVYHLFGLAPDVQRPTYEAFMAAVHPDDRAAVAQAVRHALAHGTYEIAHRIVRPNGEIRHVQERARVTVDERGRAVRMIGTVQDITEAHRLQSQLWERAHYDALTGLPNRALLLDHLDQAIREAKRERAQLAIALIDLDRFKQANDTLGHAAGDALLKEVAKRLRRSIRESDIVSRFAGDEFVAVFPGVGDADAVQNVLDKLLASFQSPCVLDGKSWRISASIGVAVYPRDGKNADALLRAADGAMYAVKRAQREVYPGSA